MSEDIKDIPILPTTQDPPRREGGTAGGMDRPVTPKPTPTTNTDKGGKK